MADRQFRSSGTSQRSKAVLKMIKGPPLSTVDSKLPLNINLETPHFNNIKLESTNINCIYARPYSINCSILNTSYETQTTYNSHNFFTLDVRNLKKTLLNDSIDHQEQQPVNTPPIELDLTCSQLIPIEDSPIQNVNNNTSRPFVINSCDFDLDDSDLDKKYCGSDWSNESPVPRISKSIKTTKKHKSSRSKSTDVTTNAADYDILEIPRKRKKNAIPLQQRKLEAKNKIKLKHSVKPGCSQKCIKKCMMVFNQEEREEINKAYWNMSWKEQHAFVEANTSVAVPNRKITSEPKRKPKRNFWLKKQDGTRNDVCKIFFLTTLGYKETNDRILHTTFRDASTDNRGKHQKTPAFDRELLNQHVELFNPLEPHYRREHTPLRRYLPSDINITKMYKDFLERYPDKTISYNLYRAHVKKMNISFTALENEACEVCEAYNLHKRELSHDATTQIVVECAVCIGWSSHYQRYKKARELYTAHKEDPRPPQRRKTVDACSSLMLSVDDTTNAADSDILEIPCKQKKNAIPLQQRKLDAKNKIKLEHSVKPGCSQKCIKKCMMLFNQEEREEINKAYWNMSWKEQHAFVEANTTVAVPKRKITSEPKRKPKRNFWLKKQDGTRTDVCKIFFLTTLGYKETNDRILHTTFSDDSTDNRGKHQKTPAFDRELLNQHVELFNPLEPHCRLEHTPLRRYLPSDINITIMYKDFLERYPDKTISYNLYRAHVKKMNISFTALENEACEICDAYNLHKREFSHDATTQIVVECAVCIGWSSHHQRYKKARELYITHKEEPQNSSQVYFSANLEKVIMLPRLKTFQTALFCQRLLCYNQTFAPLGKITSGSKPLTVIWHDGIAGRKQEDIMSAFYHFIVRNRDVTNIHVWLDNSSTQNKNWLFYSMLVHLINSEEICTETITLYYFEPGHTYMSCDQVHHQVEVSMKNKGKLYDLNDFEECVASINKSKETVKSMAPEHFFNLENYISDRRIQTTNPRAYLKNMVEVRFTRRSYDLTYKNNFDENYISLRFMNDIYLKNPNKLIFKFRMEPKGIEPERKKDILKKLSSIIPPHKLVFWKTLPTKKNEYTSDLEQVECSFRKFLLISFRKSEKNKLN